MSFQDTQNPGIGGLVELTSTEKSIIQAIAALGIPASDSILFYDVSFGGYNYLTTGTGISITGTVLSASGGSGVSGTINTIAYFDTTTSIASLALVTYPSLAELAFVKGVTSAIQTQINNKQASGTYVTSISIATANGISGSSSGGATPALTLSLGAITPTSIGSATTATTQAPADNSTKLATTAYVDAAVLGQRFKEACKYGTTSAIAASVYANGASGVGATLTEVGLGAITFDGSTPSIGDRILIKNQASTFQNGIYTVTVVGTAGTSFVLTRAIDFNQASEIQTGDSTFITSGSTLSNTTFTYTGGDSPVMGTDAITWAQSAGQGTVTSGNGITVTGLSVAINTAVTADLSSSQALTNKTYNGNTFTAGTGVLTIAAAKTLTVSNTLTLAGTDGKGINVGAATSGKILVGDGSNMVLSIPTFPNASATSGKIIKSDGTNWVASTETYAAPGTSGNVLTSDGTNWTSAAAAGGGEWTYLSKVTYAGTNGAQSFTSLSVHDSWKLVYRLYNTTTTDLSQQLTLNNVTASNYNTYYISTGSGGWAAFSGQAYFRPYGQGITLALNLEIEIVISGKHRQGVKSIAVSYISDGNTARSDTQYGQTGVLTSDSNDLTRIDINTIGVCTGTVELWYKDAK